MTGKRNVSLFNNGHTVFHCKKHAIIYHYLHHFKGHQRQTLNQSRYLILKKNLELAFCTKRCHSCRENLIWRGWTIFLQLACIAVLAVSEAMLCWVPLPAYELRLTQRVCHTAMTVFTELQRDIAPAKYSVEKCSETGQAAVSLLFTCCRNITLLSMVCHLQTMHLAPIGAGTIFLCQTVFLCHFLLHLSLYHFKKSCSQLDAWLTICL